MRGRSLGASGLVLVAVLVLAAAAAAANIVGTPRADVLRGTAKADRISGGKGNDRLYGLGGNDVLTGGPGFDRFFCRPGRDTANAERGEPVANCEVVRRPAPPPPPPPAEPPPPPPPPPPPAPKAQAGKYCGFTQQGPGICLQTDAASSIINELITAALVDCTDGSRWEFAVTLRGERATIQSDLSFAYAFSGPLRTSGSLTDAVMSYRVSGRLGTDGTASGSVAITSLTFKYDGEPFTCSQNDVIWTAKIG